MRTRFIACALGMLTVLTVLASIQVTTRTAAAVPDQGWGAPAPLVAHHDGSAYGPVVAGSPTGTVFATWVQGDSLRQSVWANVFVPGGGVAGQGGGWSARLDTSPYFAGDPAVAADGSGNAMAAWNQYNAASASNVFAARYLVGTGWLTPVQIDSSGTNNVYIRIGGDSSGDAIVTWWQSYSGGVWANRFVPGAGWGTAAAIDTNANYLPAAFIPISVSSTGQAIAAWWQWDGSAHYNIYANRFIPGSRWAATETLIDTTSDQ